MGLPGAGEVHVWWMSLAAPPWPVTELAAWLDAEESARAARFAFEEHRRRFVAARAMLRMLLGSYAGVPPAAVQFEYGAHGKPSLGGAAGALPLSFNLSHSGDEALLGIAGGAAIGVDIEVQRHLPDLEAIARGHFSAAEIRCLYSLAESQRHDGFFAAWTRKEAYVKALGAGLAVALDSFDVELHPDRPATLQSIDGSDAAARGWTLWATRPTAASWAAVAIHAPCAAVRTFSLR